MSINWEKAKEIFAEVRKLTPELRLPFVREVCADDAAVRREVESLLASYAESEEFLESPAVGEVADVIYQSRSFEKGKSFGHYEIVERIGIGGMGEVYLAEDKKLNRPVAVKILNERFARHESNVRRFIQEARAASTLNHPNILVIHEIGGDADIHYIVSEFIKGKTLRQILNEKSLTLAEILQIAVQIADALRAAHDAHLVHRDIKPENIMIRRDGIVKVLDFGLAKLIGQNPNGFATNFANENQTAKGVILGTVNYMSPEQAEGKKIDFRSDIFSFGIILYEMLTGQNPFKGETVSHTIIAILEKEPPPLTQFSENFPTEIETIIKKCLKKNVANRYESAEDLLADLRTIEKNQPFETNIEHIFVPKQNPVAKTQNVKVETGAEISDQIQNNLSENLYPIIGREKEISEIKNLLRQLAVRLVTLTGIGGVGKTRLAQAVARDLLLDFPDGVFFIELAAVDDPKIVASTIAKPLGVQESGNELLLEILKSHLKDKKILLVIDNFEQVTDAAPHIGELLNAASPLKVLITSRTFLYLSAEVKFIVPSLAVPSEIEDNSPEKLANYEAVKLFVEKARKAKPEFALTIENAASVAAICARLDGLPLAIELAAARIKILAPQAILAKLAKRLPLLTGGARDLPERQQTMRGAIDWSYSVLNEPEKHLFRRLAVFAGGFTFEAAEIVCGSDQTAVGQIDFLDLLTALADKSLLVTKEQNGGETRFRMLEVVREHALELLEANEQANEMRRAHALYFLELAEKAESFLQAVQEGEWLKRLAEEYDNLRAALSWSFEFAPEIAARLAGSLRLFWNFQGHLTEGREWFEKILNVNYEIPPNTRWKILYGAGILANLQGDYHSSRKFLEQSRQAADLTGDRRLTAVSNNILAMVLCELEEYDEAQFITEQSLAIGRELNDQHAIARSLLTLGEVARSKDDYAAARRFYEESLEIFRQLNMKNGMVGSLLNLGMVAYYQNDFATSQTYYEQALKISRELKLRMMTFFCLDGFAALALKNNKLEQAARLSGAAETLGKTINFVPEKEDRRFRNAYLAELKNKMSEADFSEFYEQGTILKPEEAFALISPLEN